VEVGSEDHAMSLSLPDALREVDLQGGESIAARSADFESKCASMRPLANWCQFRWNCRM